MDHTFVDEKSLNSLEEYAVILLTSMKSLETLAVNQKRAIEIGILKEDHAQRACNIHNHIEKLNAVYYVQLESVLELLPEDFKAEPIIAKLQAKALTKARSMLRKPKVAKDA